MMEGTSELLSCSFSATAFFVSGCIIATRLLVVPRSIPTIISSFCKLPVAMLMPIFATATYLHKSKEIKKSRKSGTLYRKLVLVFAGVQEIHFTVSIGKVFISVVILV